MSSVAEEVIAKESAEVAFKHILVATDFSEASRRAFAQARLLARKYRADVTLAHAIPPAGSYSPIPLDPLPRELDRQFSRAQEEMEHLCEAGALSDVPFHFFIREAEVWDLLSNVTQREHTDLIVIGTHGRGGFAKLVLGSTAERILRVADAPVMTVGPHVPEPSDTATGFPVILFATDFGPACERALPFAVSLAKDCGSKLILLHVVPLITMGPAAYAAGEFAAGELSQWETRLEHDSVERLHALLPADANLACDPEYLVERNFVPEGILNVAASRKADLIVMGVNAASAARLSSHFPWNVAHEVICRAGCPVLTVRE